MATETKRDLNADLAICEAATPGNWYSGVIGAEPMAVWYNVIGGPKLREIADDISVREDAQFIAEARTGWPIAIERAINAEKELAQLRAGIAAAMTYPPGIIRAKLRKVLEAIADE